MMQPLSAAILCLLSPVLDGVRFAKSNLSGSIGKVSALYTFGAPHVSHPALFEDACMPGYRIITYENTPWYIPLNKEDLVPTLLVPTKYDHPNIKTLKLEPNKKRNGGERGSTWKCGDNPTRLTTPDSGLHDKDLYINIMRNMPASWIRPGKAGTVGLKNSYETNVNKVKTNLRDEGFRLVGRATKGEDVVNLMQEHSSSRCIITFEGSDSASDWMTNFDVDRVGFCGLKARVHKGFRAELMKVIETPAFQMHIRPKLGKCASLDVTGHSLGGAVATLFTACVNGQKSGEYNLMSFEKEAAELMTSL